MTTQPPLNPDALEAGAKALLAVQQPEVSADYAWNVQFEDGRDELRNEARVAVSAYLTVARSEAATEAARMREMVAEAIDNPGESVHGFVSLPDLYQLLGRLAAAQPVATSVDPQSTPEGHYDAWRDTGDGYTQRKGWTLTCLWCGSEFTGSSKAEALKGYRGHEESIMRALHEADAERAKSSPAVNDA